MYPGCKLGNGWECVDVRELARLVLVLEAENGRGWDINVWGPAAMATSACDSLVASPWRAGTT